MSTRSRFGDTEKDCPTCGEPRAARHRKPKLLSYLLFVGSFILFLIYTSRYRIGKIENLIWLVVQLALGAWAAVDRRRNGRPVFYCRKCQTSLAS